MTRTQSIFVIFYWFTLICILSVDTGCGTSVGNPQTSITLRNQPYTVDVAAALISGRPSGLPSDLVRAVLPLAGLLNAVQGFRICVSKVKLEAEDGTLVKKNGSDEMEVALGLVDLSNSASTTTWGAIDIPVDFSLSELKVEMRKNRDVCDGADYSLFYDNGSGAPSKTINRDFEFRFKFNPPVLVKGGSFFTLELSAIAQRLDQAASAGELDDNNVEKYLDASVKGSGKQE